MSIIEPFKEQIRQLYISGKSIRQVASELGLNYGVVGKYVKAIGISRTDINGKNNPFYGKKHTEKFKLEHSLFMTGRPAPNKGKQKHKPSKYFEGALIHKWQENAKSRDIEWHLTHDQLDELWITQDGCCALTGRKMIPSNRSDKMIIASLDRIYSNKSYIIDNVQLVTGMINIMKNVLNNEEFIILCQEVCAIHE